MKAIVYKTPGPIDREDSLQDIVLEIPKPGSRDLLVKINAVSVNPVDTKLRSSMEPENGEWGLLGFDAAGIVETVGDQVENFKPGDDVFYAGSINRPGTNSEYHLVDERIVGKKPSSLTFAESAALPLTAMTAWEMLFDRLNVNTQTVEGGNLILIVGGAGGVGSIAIQLLKQLTNLTIIATASRPETQEWVRKCGAHHVIDHSKPMATQVEALGLGAPGFVFSTTHSGQHLPDIVELIAPQGRFGLIDDPEGTPVILLKSKSISIHWEFMFTRPLFETTDMEEQGKLLNQLAELVDAGKIQSTASETAGKIDAATLRSVHARIETHSTRGKIVLEGF